MAGIERITEEILQDARKEAEKIIKDAKALAEKNRSEALKKAEEIKAAQSEQLSKKLSLEDKKTESQCEQAEKMIILSAKQEIIDDILKKAKAKIYLQETGEYFDTLLKLLDKQCQADKGILLLSKKDLDRMPQDFEKQAKAVATKNGGMLDIASDAVSIDGGFILKYGNIEINSSLDALFEENREELVDIVNSLLW